MELHTLFRDSARRFGHRPALSFLSDPTAAHADRTLSYEQLLAEITQAANVFIALGIEPGQTVALVLPNLLQTHLALWGGAIAATSVPINPALGAGQMAHIVRKTSARIVVTHVEPQAGLPSAFDAVRAAIAGLGTVAAVLVIGGDGGGPRAIATGHGEVPVLRFEDCHRAQPSDALLRGRDGGPQRYAAMFHTGGTTGAPKIAPHTQRNHGFLATSFARLMDFGVADTVLCGLPLFHVNGALLTGLSPFSAGSHVLLAGTQGFRSRVLIDNFWGVVERFHVTCFSAVPTVYSSLLESPPEGFDLSSLRYGICGAAPMAAGLLTAFQGRTGVRIVEGYGLTEGTCASVLNPPAGECRVGSIGLPMPGQQVKPAVLAANADGTKRWLRWAEVGESGPLLMSGPQVFPGYLGEPLNAPVWVEVPDARTGLPLRWLDTGDIACVDADGYLWLTGREKDLIIRGGHNIDPRSIEDALTRHPAVRLAAAVGQPDAYAGELPVCYVVLREGLSADADELLAFARREIPERAAAPVRIACVERLPLTEVGKVFKPALRADAAAHAVRALVADTSVAVNVTLDSANPGGLRIHVQVPTPSLQSLVAERLSVLALATVINVASSDEHVGGATNE